jgi:hypothetical protein
LTSTKLYNFHNCSIVNSVWNTPIITEVLPTPVTKFPCDRFGTIYYILLIDTDNECAPFCGHSTKLFWWLFKTLGLLHESR